MVQKQVIEHVAGKEAAREMCGIFGILNECVYAICVTLCLVNSKHWYLLSFKHIPGIVLSIGHKLDHLVLATILWGGHNYKCPHFTSEDRKSYVTRPVSQRAGIKCRISICTVFSWLPTEVSWRGFRFTQFSISQDVITAPFCISNP